MARPWRGGETCVRMTLPTLIEWPSRISALNHKLGGSRSSRAPTLTEFALRTHFCFSLRMQFGKDQNRTNLIHGSNLWNVLLFCQNRVGDRLDAVGAVVIGCFFGKFLQAIFIIGLGLCFFRKCVCTIEQELLKACCSIVLRRGWYGGQKYALDVSMTTIKITNVWAFWSIYNRNFNLLMIYG